MDCHLQRENYVFQQIGHLLSSSHELSTNILRRLGYGDLLTASKVCSLWFTISKFILNKERRLRYTVIHPQGIPTTESTASLESHPDPQEALYYFLEQTNCNTPSYCLVFANGEWLFRKDIHSSLNPRVSTLSMVMANAVPPYCQLGLICASGVIGSIEALKPVPGAGLFDFISSCVTEKDTNIDKTNYRTSSETNDASTMLFSNQNLENADFADEDLIEKVGYSIEIEEIMLSSGIGKAENLDAISIIMFPRLHGVKMNVCYYDKEKMFKKYRPNSLPQKNIVINDVEFNSMCNLEPNEELKALLLFYTDDHDNFTEAFVNAAVARQSQNLALGGGLVRAVQQMGDIQIAGQIAVTFSGNNVKAFSIVVPPIVKNESALELHLIKLKEHYIPEAQNICFMFACCGRGQLWYQGNKMNSSGQFNNVESKMFRKLFPNVPLFGFFGEGEVGLNYLPSDLEKEVPKKKRKKRIFHQYTTIFVLISIL